MNDNESSHLSFAVRPYYTQATPRITMPGPFDFSMITEEHPYYARLLRNAISQLGVLPDFSEDSRVAVYSDFGGEHKGAHFNTYSFLIVADNKIGPFVEAVKELRLRHGILDQYSEFAFKDLDYGPRLRALPEFLRIVDTLLHGAIVTIAIDKNVPTVFGPHKKEAHAAISALLAKEGLGAWDGATGEKVLRVCHSIALFVGLTTKHNQRLLWYCDSDAINAQGRLRSFEHTQQIFRHCLGMYCKNGFEMVAAAKSFDGKSYLDDLLSIADFAAGVVQDMLQVDKTGATEMPGEAGKTELLKWMAKPSTFLSKITIQISPMADGQTGSSIVQFAPPR